MGLRIKKSSSRTSYKGFRPFFYVQYRGRLGNVTEAKLTTRLAGTPPEFGDLSKKGDDEFENAKSVATFEMKRFLENNMDARTSRSLYARSVQEAAGKKVGDIKLSELSSWMRERENHQDEKKDSKRTRWNYNVIENFAQWASANGHPTAYSVTDSVANDYCIGLTRTLSKDTLQHVAQRLKTTFKAFMPFVDNPFERAYKVASEHLTEDADPVKKRPLSEDEIMGLWRVAAEFGDMWRDIVVCATCTGLRIGDVCNLRWSSVDLKDNILHDVKNTKTGAVVSVPIFDYDTKSEFFHPILGEMRKILETIDVSTSSHASGFVFEEAHKLYQENPDGVYKRGKIMFAKVFHRPQVECANKEEKQPPSENEVKKTILASCWANEKKVRILKSYDLKCQGKSYQEIAHTVGHGNKGRVSDDFREIEKLVGCRLRPGNSHPKEDVSRNKLIESTRLSRTGRRAASLYGWHSLRHTFVVLAVNAGVPIDTVRQIVGHTTTTMTTEYFNPTAKIAAENMRKVMSRRRAVEQEKHDDDVLATVLKALPDEARNKILAQAALELAQAKMLPQHPKP